MSNENKFWTPPKSVIEADITGLMNQELTVVFPLDYSGDREHIQCILSIDPYVGISLVAKEDTDSVVYCLHGPFDPNYREFFLEGSSWFREARSQWTLRYPALAKVLQEAVKDGEIWADTLDQACVDAGSSIGVGFSKPCPFGV